MGSIAKFIVLTYSFAVILFNDSALGAKSAPPPAHPNRIIPNAPTSFEVYKLSNLIVDLEWVDSSADEEGFLIERWSSKTHEWKLLKTVGAGIQEASDNTIEGDVDYLYRVRAFNAAGDSLPSIERSIDIVEVRYWIQNGGSPFPKGHPTPNGQVKINGTVNNTPCTIPWGDSSSTSASWGMRSSKMTQHLERGKAYAVEWNITTAPHGTLDSWYNFEGNARIESNDAHYIYPPPGDIIYNPPPPAPPLAWPPATATRSYSGNLYIPKVRVTAYHPAKLNTSWQPVATGDDGRELVGSAPFVQTTPPDPEAKYVRVDLEVLPTGMPVGVATLALTGGAEAYMANGDQVTLSDMTVDFANSSTSKLSNLKSGPVTLYVKQSVGTNVGGVQLAYNGAGISVADTASLLPVEMRITDRDDAKRKWANNVLKTAPVYSGKTTGDMVSWKLGGTDIWTTTTFTWSAEGPESKTGPTGPGKNEWKIADGDADTDHDWIDWKPGKYKIKCQISSTGGSNSTAEFEQEVGVRTDDVVVVGWIDPQQVMLTSSGVQSGLLEVFPPGGLSASDGDNAKLKAAMLVKHIAEVGVASAFEIDEPWYSPVPGGIMIGVDFTAFSAADKTYAINWMFKYAGNPPPPGDFTDNDGFFSQSELDEFETKQNKTLYKLLNHYQARYLVTQDRKFKSGTLVHLKYGAAIGNTKDPARFYEISGPIDTLGPRVIGWFQGYPEGGVFPGMAREHNSNTAVVTDTTTKLCNEGTPDQKALDAFKNLTGHDQGYIWSSITFFSDLQHYSETISPSTGQSLTRAPKPTEFYQGRINTQVYPTYWIYINGQKKGVQSQAPSPSALFPNTDKAQ